MIPALLVAAWQVMTVGSADLLSIGGTGDIVVAGGMNGALFRSADRGGTWTPVASGTSENIGAIWASGTDMLAFTSDGGVLRSTDRGLRWKVAVSGSRAPEKFLMDAWGNGADVFVANGDLRRSRDGGKTWHVAWKPEAEDEGMRSVAGSGRTVLAAGNRGSLGILVRSTDGGATWTSSVVDDAMGVAGPHGVADVLVSGREVLLAGALCGRGWEWVRRSADLGATWAPNAEMLFEQAEGVCSSKLAARGSERFGAGYFGISGADGGSWHVVRRAEDERYMDIWVSPKGDVIAVGGSGVSEIRGVIARRPASK